MKYVPIMLATIGLIAVSAANHAAQADATLYTSATHAGKFDCNVVNVSEKTLNITIAIVDGTAIPPAALNSPSAQTAMPGAEVSSDFPDATTGSFDAYCVIQVSGTGNRNDVRANDVRAALNTTRATTFKLPNDATNYPTLVFKVLEAH
jgi:hypothetical protein